MQNSKKKTLEYLREIRESFWGQIVWTNGCFDILHKGHKDYLEKARSLGNCLIVGLNSDGSVRKLKGAGRPVNDGYNRGKNLFSLRHVSYVVVFDELSPIDYIRELKPDFYVKGGDYHLGTINQDERKLVESYGGKIVIIPKVHKVSTSEIIEKMNS